MKTKFSTEELRKYQVVQDVADLAVKALDKIRELEALLDNEQPQRKPLTNEQRREIAFRWRDGNGTASEIIDMVEAAHGIKGD